MLCQKLHKIRIIQGLFQSIRKKYVILRIGINHTFT